MPADLQFWHPDFLGVAKGKLLWRHVNTLNTPISSSSWLQNGAAIPDVYELVFTKVGGVVTCTVECLIAGTKNPYRDMVGAAVVADGATVNRLIVPGVGLVVSATVDTGWKARIAILNYLEDDGTYVAFFGIGIVTAGTTSTGQQVALKNVGDATSAQTKLYSLPDPRIYGGSYDTWIAEIAPHSNTTRHKMAPAGTKTITYANFRDDPGLSGNKAIDVYVDGNLAILAAVLDNTTVYEYGSANGYDDTEDGFRGCRIRFRLTVSDPTAETHYLHVTEGYTWEQFAPDSGGSPGTYANQDLDMTQSGQPTGTILAGGSALFWHRNSVPGAATAGDIRRFVLRGRGLTV